MLFSSCKRWGKLNLCKLLTGQLFSTHIHMVRRICLICFFSFLALGKGWAYDEQNVPTQQFEIVQCCTKEGSNCSVGWMSKTHSIDQLTDSKITHLPWGSVAITRTNYTILLATHDQQVVNSSCCTGGLKQGKRIDYH